MLRCTNIQTFTKSLCDIRIIAIFVLSKPHKMNDTTRNNILIINGSPKKNGIIYQMLIAAKEDLVAAGSHVVFLNTIELDVAPCKGCMSCRNTGDCILPNDGAQKLLYNIRECNAILIGVPCYWGNIPGQVKMLFDRIVYGLIDKNSRGLPKPLHKGKKIAVISTCTTGWPWNILFRQSSGAVRAIREIFRWSGFRFVASYQRGNTRRHSITERDLTNSKRLAQRLL